MNALDLLLRDLGTELLYSGLMGGLPVQSANQRLQEIVPLISDGQASIVEAKAARDNAAVQELSAAVAVLEAERDAQLIVIGQAALAARRGNPATLAKIDRLLRTTANPSSRSMVTKIVAGTAGLVTVGLLVVSGLWFFGGKRQSPAPGDVPAPLANRFNSGELQVTSAQSSTTHPTEDITPSRVMATTTRSDDPVAQSPSTNPTNSNQPDEPDDFVVLQPAAQTPIQWQNGLLSGELRPAGEIDRRRGAPVPQLSLGAGDIVMAVVGQEGRIWNLALGKELLRFEAAGKFWGRIRFALSPDGKLLAAIRSSTGGGVARSGVRVYDLQQQRWIWNLAGDENSLPIGLDEPSFSSDSRHLIGTGEVGKGAPVFVWEAATGREILALPKDSPLQRVHGRLTERDTRNWLVLRNRSGTECVLYDLRTGNLAHTLPIGAEEIKGFSTDGTLAVVQAGRDVQCLELTANPPRTVWTAPARRASLVLAPSSQVLLSDGNSTLGDFVHDLLTGAQQYRWRSTAAGIQTMPSSADGQILVVGGGLHDTRSGTLMAALPIDNGNEMGNPYLISTAVTTGNRIVSMERNGRVAVWNPAGFVAADLVRVPNAVWKLSEPVKNVAISPDGQRVAVITEQGPLRMVARATATEFPWSIRIEKPSSSPRFVANGQRILGMRAREGITPPALPVVWNSTTGQPVAELFTAGASPQDRAELFACSPDGVTVALRVTQAASTKLRFCHTEPTETVSELDWPATAFTTGQFSADGSRFSLANGNGATIYDVATGETRATISFASNTDPIGVPGPTSSFPILTPDGLTLLRVFGRDNQARKPIGCTVEMWDIATQQRVRTINLCMPISDALFLDDGRTIASMTGRDIRLWDLTTGTLRGLLVGHEDIVQSLDYATATKTLISAGRDGTVCFWNIGDLQRWQSEWFPNPLIITNRPATQPMFPPRGMTPASAVGTTPSPAPVNPVAVELTPEQIEARQTLLDKFAKDTLLRGDWSFGKYTGRFALRVTKPPGEDLIISAEAFEPGKSKDTKTYLGRLELDKESGAWQLVWQGVAESGLRRNPSRVPASANLLLFGDQRTIRLKLVNGEWRGKDSSEVVFQFTVVDVKVP